jgi:2-C-methyl-D-erythritol 4-phosphate cytidylyltransferase
VIRPQDRASVHQTLEREVDAPEVLVVDGGESRHGSEWAALQALAPAITAQDIDVVVIHDAARPLAGTLLFAEVVATAIREGGAVPVLEQRGLTPLDGELVEATATDERAVSVQTPQAFRAGPLLAAYERAHRDGFIGTDTASCIERYTELPVRCVPGDARNIKITYPEDLFLAERLLAKADWDLSDSDAAASLRAGAPATQDHPHLPHLGSLLRRRAER